MKKQKVYKRLLRSMEKKPLGLGGGKWLTDLGFFFSGLVLGRVQVGDFCAPFGLSVLGAAPFCGVHPLFPAAGVLLSALPESPPLWGVMIAAAVFSLLVTAVEFFAPEAGVSAKLLLFILTQAAVLPFQMDGAGVSVAYALLSASLSALGVFLILRCHTILRRLHPGCPLNGGEQLCLAGLLGLILLGLWGLAAGNVSLPMVLLYGCMLVLVYARGMGGVGVGVLLGAVLAFGDARGTQLLGAYALSTLLCALTAPYGRGYLLVAFLLSQAVSWVFLTGEQGVVTMENALAAAMLFGALPGEWLACMEGLLNENRSRRENTALAIGRIQEQTARQMEQTARLCAELAGLFMTGEGEGRYLEAWSLGAAQGVCRGCEGRVLCWRDREGMEKAILSLLPAYDRGESVRPLPPMDMHCRYFHELLSAAYQSYNQAFAHEAGLRRAARQYAYMNRQLSGLAAALFRQSNRLREDAWVDDRLEMALFTGLQNRGMRPVALDAFYPGEGLHLRLSLEASGNLSSAMVLEAVSAVVHRPMRLLKARRKEGNLLLEMEEGQKLKSTMAVVSLPESPDAPSGDASGEYRLPSGRVIYAVSDGMGSGERARQESDEALHLLFSMLRAGFERELVYENVNRLLLHRAREEMYATLDSAHIDLSTGETELMKFGAPPTCLLRGGIPRFLCGESLPCGIVDEARPYVQRIHLRRQDRLIFVTDGVFDLLGRELEPALRRWGRGGDRELAQAILEEAKSRGQRDDMTVMVVGIE